MGFLEANYTTFIKKYANFSGRASRAEFWWFRLSYLIISRLFLLQLALGLKDDVGQMKFVTEMQFYIFCAVFDIIMVIPLISVTSRRLHDRDISGMWSILIVGQLSFSYLAFFLAYDTLQMRVFAGFLALAVIILHIVLMFKGTDGANKYGPDPLRPNINVDTFA